SGYVSSAAVFPSASPYQRLIAGRSSTTTVTVPMPATPLACARVGGTRAARQHADPADLDAVRPLAVTPLDLAHLCAGLAQRLGIGKEIVGLQAEVHEAAAALEWRP